MQRPGDALEALCAAAEKEVLLIAPFMKAAVVETLINCLSNSTSVTVVTRWYPEEIASGVSDLEVWDVIEGERRGKVMLHQQLHAKYFRADDHALVGSANLTRLALGWASPANVELLVPDDPRRQVLAEFEATVFAGTVRATRTVRDRMEEEAAAIESDAAALPVKSSRIAEEAKGYAEPSVWVPQCGRPDCLFDVYRNYDTEALVEWTVESGRIDLAALRVPPGLSRSEFDRCVATGLLATEFVRELDNVAGEPVPDARGKAIVTRYVTDSDERIPAEDRWEVIKLWLTCFLPNTFRLRSGTGELVKGQVIGNQTPPTV